jgi:serine/threonine protein kinase
MPVYDGNLYQLLERLRDEEPEAVRPMTNRMLYQILDALDFVHTYNPQIIHRDIKPANILYQGDKFLLTDFGIAKVVDTLRTMAGSKWYAAPEVRQNGEQTPKVDIYGLGITFVECLEKLPPEAEREVTWQHWELWHRHLQTLLNQHKPQMAPMLADVADQRPTARDLLEAFFPQPAYALQGPQNGITPSSFRVSSPRTNQVNGTTMIYSAAPTLMEWTRTGATAFFQGKPWPRQRDESTQPSQPNPAATQSPKVPPNRQPGIRRKGSVKSAKSVDERQKKGHKRGGSSHNTPSQPAGVSKRTSSSRRWRSRSKSIQKAQEVRVLGMA